MSEEIILERIWEARRLMPTVEMTLSSWFNII